MLMPHVAQSSDGLRQGEVLKCPETFALFATGPDGPVAIKCGFVLLLSRDCNLEREKYVQVAPVKKWEKPLFDASNNGFDSARRLMNELRLGSLNPDSFYLGTIPGDGVGRYAAGLKRTAMVELRFLKSDSFERVGFLGPDHLRALRNQMHNSYARVGFDDVEGYCEADQMLLVKTISSELSMLVAAVSHCEAVGQHKKKSAAEKKVKDLLSRLGDFESNSSYKNVRDYAAKVAKQTRGQ